MKKLSKKVIGLVGVLAIAAGSVALTGPSGNFALAAGSDPNPGMKAPLAIVEKKVEVAKVLETIKADVTIPGITGETKLDVAVTNANSSVVDLSKVVESLAGKTTAEIGQALGAVLEAVSATTSTSGGKVATVVLDLSKSTATEFTVPFKEGLSSFQVVTSGFSAKVDAKALKGNGQLSLKKGSVIVEMTIDGKPVTQLNPAVQLEMVAPFDAKKADTFGVAYKVGSDGSKEYITDSYFAGGKVYFAAKETGRYDVALNETKVAVAAGNYAENFYNYLAARGLVINNAPKEYMSRADFINYYMELVDVTGVTPAAQFSDVDSKAAYAKNIALAKTLGITNGVGNNKFNPKEPIKREEMLTIVYRADSLYNVSGKKDATGGTPLEFTDLPTDSYAKEAVAYLSARGIFKGDGEKHAMPKELMQSSQAVSIIYSALR